MLRLFTLSQAMETAKHQEKVVEYSNKKGKVAWSKGAGPIQTSQVLGLIIVGLYNLLVILKEMGVYAIEVGTSISLATRASPNKLMLSLPLRRDKA